MKEEFRTIFGNAPIQLSDLIVELETILVAYGDLPVYAGIDYDWITGTRYIKNEDEVYSDYGEHVRLE